MAKRGRRQDDETKTEKGGKERQILLQYACFGLMIWVKGGVAKRKLVEVIGS